DPFGTMDWSRMLSLIMEFLLQHNILIAALLQKENRVDAGSINFILCYFIMTYQQITALLGKENENLFTHTCEKVKKETLQLPSPNFISEVWSHSNRNLQTMRSLQQMFDTGRLSGTGYLSILPVDQGVEHSAGASFAKNPM